MNFYFLFIYFICSLPILVFNQKADLEDFWGSKELCTHPVLGPVCSLLGMAGKLTCWTHPCISRGGCMQLYML